MQHVISGICEWDLLAYGTCRLMRVISYLEQFTHLYQLGYGLKNLLGHPDSAYINCILQGISKGSRIDLNRSQEAVY